MPDLQEFQLLGFNKEKQVPDEVDRKKDRALKLMKTDREIIREQLNILVMQSYLETKKKLTRSEALTHFLKKHFEKEPEIIKQLERIEEKRIVKRK